MLSVSLPVRREDPGGTMTNKERVIRTLNHEQGDICPWNITFTVPAARKMAEYYGDEDFRDRIGCHIAMVMHAPSESWTEVAPGYWRDEFGVVWNRTVDRDIGNPDAHVLEEKDLDRIGFPDPHGPSRWTRFETFCEEHAADFIIADLGFSLFERAWTLRGMENLLVDMVADPPFVSELFERIWGGESPRTNSLEVHVLSLRKKLGAQAASRIVTVKGIGYRLE